MSDPTSPTAPAATDFDTQLVNLVKEIAADITALEAKAASIDDTAASGTGVTWSVSEIVNQINAAIESALSGAPASAALLNVDLVASYKAARAAT